MAMALPLGKLTILIGAGFVGSVLAKEGRMSGVSDFFSGALKGAVKQIKWNDSDPSTSKPQKEFLVAQVNSLRQELQLLASNRSVTIVTGGGTGSSRYGIVIVIVVVGSGYVWWKGWKLPDMMFATRHSLSEASSKIAKQLETVYSSISAAKRHLSSRIDRLDSNLDECAELTAAARDEVSELQGDMKTVGVDVQTVHHAVRTLETKISRIEGKQDLTNEGVRRLCHYAWNIENNRTTESIQASPNVSQPALPNSSRPALEAPAVDPSSRAASLTAETPLQEPKSTSSSNESNKSSFQTQKQRPLHIAMPATGLKELHGISEAMEMSSLSETPNESLSNGNVSSGIFRRRLSGLNAFITRTQSATANSFKLFDKNGPYTR